MADNTITDEHLLTVASTFGLQAYMGVMDALKKNPDIAYEKMQAEADLPEPPPPPPPRNDGPAGRQGGNNV